MLYMVTFNINTPNVSIYTIHGSYGILTIQFQSPNHRDLQRAINHCGARHQGSRLLDTALGAKY